MFVAWGPELRFLYNDAYAEILGRKHPAAMGSRFEDIWPEVWADVEPIAAKALRGESSYNENLPLRMNRRGFDEQTWFTFSYSPVRDDAGEIAGLYCAVTETTSEVLNERARQEENERLLALFAQAPSVMAVLREPGHVFELANASYHQLAGGRELLGRPFREALPELEGQGFFELIDQVATTGEAFRADAAPVQFVRPDGRREQYFFNYVLQPIKNPSGQVAGIFMEGNDVTAAVRANHALRAANRRKDEFLAMLAHELRNPLAPISAAADLLAVTGHDPDVVRQSSAIIARQVRHMTGLVDDLLDVSRVTRGLIRLQEQPFDIVSIIGDAVEQVRGLFQARRQHLTLHLPAQAATVLGDRTRLVQIVANLLNNAAKYTAEEGHVEVRAAVLGDEIDITVQDDGVGIAPELLPHVFDLFTQAERSLDRTQGGLGLGLALVKSLVDLHGGRVEAESDGPGTGSRFVVRLPRATVPAPKSPQDRRERIVGSPRPLRLLVVDDNVDAAESLCLLLQALGHHAMVEHDAIGALERAQRERPQLLFLDIGLPEVDGLELARRLRALPETAEATIVAVTGYGQPEDQERTRQAGFDHHMTKPVKLPEILALIEASARKAVESPE
ncbi:MAG: PAS domain-containing protein [Lysobacter sp.]|nr:PAS domain-containing protein [Lysobacter sp.]